MLIMENMPEEKEEIYYMNCTTKKLKQQ